MSAKATDAEWLARMRWGALGIQAASILIANQALDLDMPAIPMWSLVAVGVASNLWLAAKKGAAGELGGFLVLEARDLLTEPGAWKVLIRTLRSRKLPWTQHLRGHAKRG